MCRLLAQRLDGPSSSFYRQSRRGTAMQSFVLSSLLQNTVMERGSTDTKVKGVLISTESP